MSQTTDNTETKETCIKIPACVVNFANKSVDGLLPEVITKHLPKQVNETKMRVAVPVAGVAGYVLYRLIRKMLGKTPAPKA